MANAIASKADINSPNLTGTPTASTATAGTNTTQLATTAFVTTALRTLYPVGSIYINATSSTNPATLLGFGTWAAFGAGRMMVGLNSSDTLFDTAEETGGSKNAIVVSHTHTYSATTTSGQGGHVHYYPELTFGVNSGTTGVTSSRTASTYYTGYREMPDDGTNRGQHTHTISGTTASAGSSGTNANLPPYIVVRMWKRTA